MFAGHKIPSTRAQTIGTLYFFLTHPPPLHIHSAMQGFSASFMPMLFTIVQGWQITSLATLSSFGFAGLKSLNVIKNEMPASWMLYALFPWVKIMLLVLLTWETFWEAAISFLTFLRVSCIPIVRLCQEHPKMPMIQSSTTSTGLPSDQQLTWVILILMIGSLIETCSYATIGVWALGTCMLISSLPALKSPAEEAWAFARLSLHLSLWLTNASVVNLVLNMRPCLTIVKTIQHPVLS